MPPKSFWAQRTQSLGVSHQQYVINVPLATKKRKVAAGANSIGHVTLVVGLVVGWGGTIMYNGMQSGDPDRMGAGLKQLFTDARGGEVANGSARPPIN
ncbi:MAG: hypothetical protein CM1200mP18_09710 [Gammaproteobacteria bacterium]|nr:MAG: hypothetical protein CM1200mP18_09710 [Gammaproteobacteria bacterium]